MVNKLTQHSRRDGAPAGPVISIRARAAA